MPKTLVAEPSSAPTDVPDVAGLLQASRGRRAAMELRGPEAFDLGDESCQSSEKEGTAAVAEAVRREHEAAVVGRIRGEVIARHRAIMTARNRNGVLRHADNASRSRAAVHLELRRRLTPDALREEYERQLAETARLGGEEGEQDTLDDIEAAYAALEAKRKARKDAWAERYESLAQAAGESVEPALGSSSADPTDTSRGDPAGAARSASGARARRAPRRSYCRTARTSS